MATTNKIKWRNCLLHVTGRVLNLFPTVYYEIRARIIFYFFFVFFQY